MDSLGVATGTGLGTGGTGGAGGGWSCTDVEDAGGGDDEDDEEDEDEEEEEVENGKESINELTDSVSIITSTMSCGAKTDIRGWVGERREG